MRVLIYTCGKCGAQAVGSALRIPKRRRSPTRCPCTLSIHADASPVLLRARVEKLKLGRNRRHRR